MICPKCGEAVDAEAVFFCPKCRQRIPSEAEAEPNFAAGEEYVPAGIGIRLLAGLISLVLDGPIILSVSISSITFGMAMGIPLLLWQFFCLLCFLLIIVCCIAVLTATNNGATWGKKLCAIKVVMNDGAPVTWSAAFVRTLCYPGGALLFFLGLFRKGHSEGKRLWHDIMANTLVVYTDLVRRPSQATSSEIYADPKKKLATRRRRFQTAIFLGIILLLAVIAIPKFAELVRKANEGKDKGNLGAIRSALSVYYGDLDGQYPSDLAALTIGGKYLQSLPLAAAPDYHSDSSVVHAGKTPNDAGGWLYNNILGDANIGTILINCTHTDTKGSAWNLY